MSADTWGSYSCAWREQIATVSTRSRALYAVSFLLLIVGFPAFYLSQGLHVDESLYFVLGEHVAEGSTLYVDVVDHKPPAIFYLAAAASTLVEQPHVPLRLLTYLVVAVTGILVLRLGTRLYDAGVGMVASLLYVLGSYLPHFDGFAYMTEQYVALCTVVAAGLFLRRGSLRTDVGVGLALGVGILFNQAIFLFGAVILAYVAVAITAAGDARGAVSRDAFRRVLAIGVGFVVPVGVVLASFAANGALEALVRYALVVPLTEYHPPFNAQGHLYMALSFFPVWALAFGGVCLAIWRLFRDRTPDRVLFVAIWAVVLSYPGMTQFAGDHKLLYVFPPVALLAAATLRWLWVRAAFDRSSFLPPYRGVTRAQITTALLVALAASTVAAGAFNVVYGSMVLDTSIEDQRETAAGVAEQTEGEIYTYPFAFDLVYFGEGVESPEMYFGAIYSPHLAEKVTTSLEAEQVPYVVVHRSYVSENGAIEGSGYFAESESMVGEYIGENYERVGTSGNYVVYERIDSDKSTDVAVSDTDAAGSTSPASMTESTALSSRTMA